MSAVWESAEYSGSTLLLLLALADYAQDDGGKVFPSVDSLAAKTRCDRRTVQRNLRRLQTDGAIVEVAPGTRRSPAEYKIGAAFCRPSQDVGRHPVRSGAASRPAGAASDPSRGGVRPPNSPINHQLESSVESGGDTPPLHTHDSDEAKTAAKPPTEDQLTFIRSLCRQRDIAVPHVGTATEAAELIDDLKAGKLPERAVPVEVAPVEPHPSNFGRCGRCKANPVRRNAMGLCESCVEWLAEDKAQDAEAVCGGETAP